MADFRLVAVKEEVIVEELDEISRYPHQLGSNESEENSESSMRHPMKTETPESASSPLEGANGETYDEEFMKALQTLEDTAYLSDSDYEGHMSVDSSDSEEEEKESCLHQQRKEETPQSALGPSEGGEAASVEKETCVVQPVLITIEDEADAEAQSSTCEAGSSEQEKGQEPRTEASGAMQGGDGRSGGGKGPPFRCNLCPKQFSRKDNFDYHMKVHSGVKPFNCETCSYSCIRKSHLETHIRTHTGERPFSCKVCSRSFSQKVHLQTHIHTHTGEKPYGCETCGRRFSLKAHLQSHLRIHTADERRQHKAQSSPCEAGSSEQEKGQEPRTEASGAVQGGDGRSGRGNGPPFCCNLCPKQFNSRGGFRYHMKLHSGVKPFNCETCSYSCIKKSHLETHIRTHTGERPFSCKVCEHTFSQKVHLQRHISVHTGEKPYGCETCGRCFSEKAKLKSHLRIHTDNVHRQDKSAAASVKEEEEESLAQPELVLCKTEADDAEESAEEQVIDPLSTDELKKEEDLNCVESMGEKEVDPLSTMEIKKEDDVNCVKAEEPQQEFDSLTIPKTEAE